MNREPNYGLYEGIEKNRFKPHKRGSPKVSFETRKHPESKDGLLMFINDEGGKEVGFVEGWPERSRAGRPAIRGRFHIGLVDLVPEYQRYGIGTRAIKKFEDEVGDAGFASISIADQSNSDFWEKLGYRETSRARMRDTPFDQVMRVKRLK